MSDDQICHVTQDVNIEIFYCVVILQLIMGIVTKFLVKKLSTSELSAKNLTGGGGKQPPLCL